MATATEISTRALRRLKVVDALQDPSAADVAAATEALNAMIASWESKGLSGDVLPLDSRFEQGVVAMLAVRLSEEYGKVPGPVLVQDATDGWSALQAAYFAVPTSSFDASIKWTGYNASLLGTIIEDLDNYAAWQASTDYEARFFVVNNFNLYECVTGGTSDVSGGPTGTGSEITDGTVVWCWRRVTA